MLAKWMKLGIGGTEFKSHLTQSVHLLNNGLGKYQISTFQLLGPVTEYILPVVPRKLIQPGPLARRWILSKFIPDTHLVWEHTLNYLCFFFFLRSTFFSIFFMELLFQCPIRFPFGIFLLLEWVTNTSEMLSTHYRLWWHGYIDVPIIQAWKLMRWIRYFLMLDTKSNEH